MIQEIIPGKKLGDFILGENINKVISLLKQKGEIYQHTDIIIPASPKDPSFILIPSEGIKLRFNYKNQKLELIEKHFDSSISPKVEYKYNKSIIFSSTKKDHPFFSAPDYRYITSTFGLSNAPSNINDKILLNCHGISFIFKNCEAGNTEPLLEKVFIFYGNSIVDNFSASFFKNKTSFKIKINSKGELKLYFYEDEKSFKEIYLGQNIEEILHIFNNANYIHKVNEQNERNEEFYLNYFNYGLDIQAENNLEDNLNEPNVFAEIKSNIKRIILHNNNILDSEFGIYDRANFVVEFDKSYLKNHYDKLTQRIPSPQINVTSSFRKLSEESNNSSLDEKALTYETEKISSFEIVNNKFNDNKENEDKEKSVEDIGSTMLNNENLIIYPWSSFSNILKKIPKNCYKQYQRNDNKINRIVQYYVFEKFVFTVLENNEIGSIIIYEK